MELLNFKIDLSPLERILYPMAYLVNEFIRRKRTPTMPFPDRKRQRIVWAPIWIIFALIMLIASILYLLLMYILVR